MNQAHAKVEEWIDAYQSCLASGIWPGWDAVIRDWDADVEFHDDDEDESVRSRSA
jgi:hypothetical protein